MIVRVALIDSCWPMDLEDERPQGVKVREVL
jgi:hypothetical protein